MLEGVAKDARIANSIQRPGFRRVWGAPRHPGAARSAEPGIHVRSPLGICNSARTVPGGQELVRKDAKNARKSGCAHARRLPCTVSRRPKPLSHGQAAPQARMGCGSPGSGPGLFMNSCCDRSIHSLWHGAGTPSAALEGRRVAKHRAIFRCASRATGRRLVGLATDAPMNNAWARSVGGRNFGERDCAIAIGWVYRETRMVIPCKSFERRSLWMRAQSQPEDFCRPRS